MKEETIRIEGMSCDGCVAGVKKALARLPLERDADVRIGSARVEYDEAEISRATIIEAIEDAGYDVPDDVKTGAESGRGDTTDAG